MYKTSPYPPFFSHLPPHSPILYTISPNSTPFPVIRPIYPKPITFSHFSPLCPIINSFLPISTSSSQCPIIQRISHLQHIFDHILLASNTFSRHPSHFLITHPIDPSYTPDSHNTTNSSLFTRFSHHPSHFPITHLILPFSTPFPHHPTHNQPIKRYLTQLSYIHHIFQSSIPFSHLLPYIPPHFPIIHHIFQSSTPSFTYKYKYPTPSPYSYHLHHLHITHPIYP